MIMKVCVICRSPRLMWITQTEAFKTLAVIRKTELNNCFIENTHVLKAYTNTRAGIRNSTPNHASICKEVNFDSLNIKSFEWGFTFQKARHKIKPDETSLNTIKNSKWSPQYRRVDIPVKPVPKYFSSCLYGKQSGYLFSYKGELFTWKLKWWKTL